MVNFIEKNNTAAYDASIGHSIIRKYQHIFAPCNWLLPLVTNKDIGQMAG